MGAKKHQFEEHEEHEGGHDEPWLVSYADMMTLLFGFFVLMYSFASKDKADEWEKVRADVAKYFGGEYVTPYDDLVKAIEKAIENTPLANEVDKKVTPDGLEITFRSTVLFESGKETIQPAIDGPMNALASVIIDKKNDVGMTIEGHTDDSPIATGKFPSNWELSAARAATVVRLFERRGFPPKSMFAVAHGETRPIFPNRNEFGEVIPENQARNRRVVIKVYSLAKNEPKSGALPAPGSTPSSTPGAQRAVPGIPSDALNPPGGSAPSAPTAPTTPTAPSSAQPAKAELGH